MLEDKSIRPVGSVTDKKIDFRIICATNRDLKKMVEQGTFREDLYYRLNVVPITIPPLRNHRDDIIPLCLHFLYHFCQKYSLQKSFSDKVLNELYHYSWPGNIRELKNFVERIVVMTPSSTKEIMSIPIGLLGDDELTIEKGAMTQQSKSTDSPELFYTRKLTKETLQTALLKNKNNRAATAEYLGISRRQLQYKIKEFHLSARCKYDS